MQYSKLTVVDWPIRTLVNPTEKTWKDMYASKPYVLGPGDEVQIPQNIINHFIGDFTLPEKDRASEIERVQLRHGGDHPQVVIKELMTEDELQTLQKLRARFQAPPPSPEKIEVVETLKKQMHQFKAVSKAMAQTKAAAQAKKAASKMKEG